MNRRPNTNVKKPNVTNVKLPNKIANKLPNVTITPNTNTLSGKISSIATNAKGKLTELGAKVSNAATDLKQKATNKMTNITDAAKVAPGSEQISKLTALTSEFMEANSEISKFVAVILSILLFYILFNLGIVVLNNMFMTKSNPIVLDGLISSNKQLVVSANPNIVKSIPILRSINKDQGLEFTWNVWFFIEDVTSIQTGNYSLIFSKGQPRADKNKSKKIKNINQMINVCPGAFIQSVGNSAQLSVALTTFVDSTNNNPGIEIITVKDIPIQKWIHCAIRVQNKSVDIYVNGIMTQRKNLLSLPKQNYNDTYIGDANGFNGYISSLKYYDHALNYDEIQTDFVKGPNMKMANDNSSINKKDFLSMNWYYNSKQL